MNCIQQKKKVIVLGGDGWGMGSGYGWERKGEPFGDTVEEWEMMQKKRRNINIFLYS